MKKGSLVYHKEFGRGIVERKSPSASLIEVRFKHFVNTIVLSSSLKTLRV